MKILLALATLTLLASCTIAPQSTPTPPTPPKVMEGSKVMTGDTLMKSDEMKDNMMMSGEVMDDRTTDMMKPTGYMNYDEMKAKEALASGQKVALFFHASWCPSCRALDSAINTELGVIPADALIMKVDYDTSTELRKKYGVTSQHTTVLIDRDMNLISKKLGARNVSEVLN